MNAANRGQVQGSDVLLSDGWMSLGALEQRDETLAMTELIAEDLLRNDDRYYLSVTLAKDGNQSGDIKYYVALIASLRISSRLRFDPNAP